MEPLESWLPGEEGVPRPAKYLAGLAYGAVLVATLVAFQGYEPDPPALVFQLLLGALWGVPVALITLALGAVYRDAARRGMNATAWTLLTALLVPGGIGFVIYFLCRKPLRRACAQCSASVRDGAAYCPQCGARLRPGCPSCRRPPRPEDRFCEACGTPLGQGSGAA
jgi:hypothetical protein